MKKRFPHLADPVLPYGLLLTALLWLGSATPSVAVPANPTPFPFVQPDGTKIMLRLRGDEFFHWHEDVNGFTVMRQGESFVYAQLDGQKNLTPTSWLVGKVDPASVGLTPRLLPPAELRPANLNANAKPYRPWAAAGTSRAGVAPMISAKGIVKNLVVLCRFSDHGDWVCPAREKFDILYNQIGGDPVIAPCGSVKDAYLENSYNIVTLQSTVLAWVTLPQPQSYYAGTNSGGGTYPNNVQKMAEDALNLVAPMVNFGDFDTDNDGFIDAIDFIHSGFGAEYGPVLERIWSRKWALASPWVSADTNAAGTKVKVQNFHTESALSYNTGTTIAPIGVICHETGHFFGLPDLYDTDNTSSGVGAWCLMAGNWGVDRPPPHFSAWCKVFLGWTVPGVPVSAGTYSLAQAETLPAALKITQGFPAGEYLLIENRQPVGLDASIPQGGLAIWHIDENMGGNTKEGYPGQAGWPQNGNHYKVALLQADGLYQLEHGTTNGTASMLYRAGTTDHIGVHTVPNTDSYQGGHVYSTYNFISNVSAPAATMYLDYSHSYFAHILYVDKYYAGPSPNGTLDAPYKRVTDAYNAAVNGDAIVIRAADYTEAPLSMTKKLFFDTKLGPASVR